MFLTIIQCRYRYFIKLLPLIYFYYLSKQLYTQIEREKKAKYEKRILEAEKGTFCPLVYATTGGMG